MIASGQRATARSYLISPEALGGLGSDPDEIRDRLSAAYLVATAGLASFSAQAYGPLYIFDYASGTPWRWDVTEPVDVWVDGGNFASGYHWMDGIGPKEKRPNIKNVFWGGTMEDNSFGTHEFLNLCDIVKKLFAPPGKGSSVVLAYVLELIKTHVCMIAYIFCDNVHRR